MSAEPSAPEGLSESGARLWASALERFPFRPTELALLESALRALDRAEKARAVVECEGLTVETPSSGVVRPHPACSIEAEARREFRIAWRTLGLVDSNGPEGD
ncbi:MAG TPA: P27 family phage terminase small subunit [Longimicrobiaceae bacterium]|nr:P27 family phage terminase small subunit [Longimicrobiaceae bacterium]